MRIADLREVTAPIASSIANAYIDFSKMTCSLVALVTDVVEHTDVWMVQAGNGSRLALESLPQFAPVGKMRNLGTQASGSGALFSSGFFFGRPLKMRD